MAQEDGPGPLSAIDEFHAKYGPNRPLPVELFLQPEEYKRLEFMRRFREAGLQYTSGPDDGAYLFLRSRKR